MNIAGSRLIIVCGLPGSGKTTHARQLEGMLHAVRFCPDEWMDILGTDLRDETMRARIESLQWNMAQTLLKRHLTVIIEWGTWRRSERDALRVYARSVGAAVELHFLDAPIDQLFSRIRQRNREVPPIELADLVKWANVFESPESGELALFDEATSVERNRLLKT